MSINFLEEYEKPELESLRTLVENLVFRLPACEEIVIRKTLQEVYRNFCRSTCVLNFVHCVKGESELPISSSMGGGEIDSISDVYCDEHRLRLGIDYQVVGKGTPIVKLERRYFGSDIRVVTIEVPGINEENVPRWFLKRYGDALVSGVLGRLMSITGKAWSDPNMAIIYWREYENAKNEARNRFNTGSEYGNGDFGFSIDSSDLI